MPTVPIVSTKVLPRAASAAIKRTGGSYLEDDCKDPHCARVVTAGSALELQLPLRQKARVSKDLCLLETCTLGSVRLGGAVWRQTLQRP